MKTMAEVIQEAIENTPYWIPGDPGTHQNPYVNAAEALAAAGYGPVRGAAAEALVEAADALDKLWGERKDKPENGWRDWADGLEEAESMVRELAAKAIQP